MVLDAFDGDLADTLIKAQEILGNDVANAESSTSAAPDFSIDLDLGVGEMAGTSVAAAKVTGAVSQVWAANPGLSFAQVKEILKKTAVDLNTPGWDLATGAGLVAIAAAVALAKRTQPEVYQPKPLLSPLTWSGAGQVTPGERAASTVSVPTFTGRIMNAGYVSTVGFLRIRSGPGQNYAEVGSKSPGDAVDFDAYDDNGSFVPDPFMPGGGSSRWYRIAGTNTWMSALYIDNTPERAEEERRRQEEIRRAEEEARRAEEEARRAEEEARRAEEELRRLEEEERRRQEQLQALITEVSQKVGDLGVLLGSDVSNGVAIYRFTKGILYIQPDGRYAFYRTNEGSNETIKLVGNLLSGFPSQNLLESTLRNLRNGRILNNAYFSQDSVSGVFSSEGRLAGWTHELLVDALRRGSVKPGDLEVEYIVRDGKTFIVNTRTSMALEEAGIPRNQWNVRNVTNNAEAVARWEAQLRRNGLINSTGELNLDQLEALRRSKPKLNSSLFPPEVPPKIPNYPSAKVASRVTRVMGTAGKIMRPIAFAIDAYRLYEAYQADDGQFGQNFQLTAGSVAGGWAGGLAGAWAGAQAGAFIGGVAGSWIPVLGTVTGAAIGGVIGGLVGGAIGAIGGSSLGESIVKNSSAISAFANDALNAAREQAKAAAQKAKE